MSNKNDILREKYSAGIRVFIKNYGDVLFILNRNKLLNLVCTLPVEIVGKQPWELPFSEAILNVYGGFFRADEIKELRLMITNYEIVKIYKTKFCRKIGETAEQYEERMQKLNVKIENHNEEMERRNCVAEEMENGENEEWYE